MKASFVGLCVALFDCLRLPLRARFAAGAGPCVNISLVLNLMNRPIYHHTKVDSVGGGETSGSISSSVGIVESVPIIDNSSNAPLIYQY